MIYFMVVQNERPQGEANFNSEFWFEIPKLAPCDLSTLMILVCSSDTNTCQYSLSNQRYPGSKAR